MRTPVFFAVWLLASVAQAVTLTEQLDAAWRIDPEARALDARAGELKARGLQIDSLLAAPPAVALAYAARLEAVLAEVDVDIAIGRLNQALGVMP